MRISRYLGLAGDPTTEDTADLLAQVGGLREEAASMSASIDRLHLSQVEASNAVRDQMDRLGTHLGDIVLAHLSRTDALRQHVDMRFDLVSDIVLATLGEVVQPRADQAGASVAEGMPIDAHPAAPAASATSHYDELDVPPRDRQSMLILSALFEGSVK